MKENMISTNSNKREYKSWEKSERSGSNHKTMRVEEIENGFLVIISEDKEVKGRYEYDCKKWFSKTNPLEKEQPLPKESDGLSKAIDEFNQQF